MIETEQTVTVRAPIGATWDFARAIGNWADLVPGMQHCEILGDDDSRWVVKVGVGGLVRTVTVDVHVDRWAGPEAVDFTYRLKGDPVTGAGSYRAAAADGGTEITLGLRVEGGGPMAPMWEAMGRPLLPQLARGFAGLFKDAVERTASVAVPPRSLWTRLTAWLRGLFGKEGQRA